MEISENECNIDFVYKNNECKKRFQVEIFSFPFYLGKSAKDFKGKDQYTILYKNNFCFRLIKNTYLPTIKKVYTTIGIAPIDFFKKQNPQNSYDTYNFYFDIGFYIFELEKIKINRFLQLDFNKKFCLGLFSYQSLGFNDFFINIGGEIATYINVFYIKIKKLQKLPFNIGFILKYWYNFFDCTVDFKNFSSEFLEANFFMPYIHNAAINDSNFSFSLGNLLNSYSGMAGISYYSCLSIKFYI